jgi:hypothetical protein
MLSEGERCVPGYIRSYQWNEPLYLQMECPAVSTVENMAPVSDPSKRTLGIET